MISNFKNKQKSDPAENFFSSPLIKIFFIIVIVFLIFADIKVYKDKNKFDEQVENLNQKIQSLQKKNDTLKQGIARADDKDYIEKIAREELDLQIQDEKVITFIMAKAQPKEGVDANNNFLNLKNWTEWISNSWQWIKDKF